MRGYLPMFCLALALLTSREANGDLVEMDLRTDGDGLVTRDTESGLDWLDPKESFGLSFNEVKAGARGLAASGWLHANGAELCDLFSKLGASPDPCPGGSAFVSFADVAEHLRLLGPTLASGQTLEIRGAYEDDGEDDTVGLAVVLIGGPGFGLLFVDDNRLSADEIDLQGGGHFLVRQIPEAELVQQLVSLLSALALLGLKGRRSTRCNAAYAVPNPRQLWASSRTTFVLGRARLVTARMMRQSVTA